MAALRTDDPRTVAGFLLDTADEPVERLARALASDEVAGRLATGLPRLSPPAARLVYHRLADAARGLLADIRVADVLQAGWQKYAALANAARRTRSIPGSQELVDLAAHRVHSVHRPQVDVLVDGVRVGAVPFRLDLEVLVRALLATVADGRLTAVDSGSCRLSARLSCCDVTLTAREREFDAAVVLDLGGGLPLLPG